MSAYFIRTVIGDYIDAIVREPSEEAKSRAEVCLDAALESLFTDGELRAASDAADKAARKFDLQYK